MSKPKTAIIVAPDDVDPDDLSSFDSCFSFFSKFELSKNVKVENVLYADDNIIQVCEQVKPDILLDLTDDLLRYCKLYTFIQLSPVLQRINTRVIVFDHYSKLQLGEYSKYTAADWMKNIH